MCIFQYFGYYLPDFVTAIDLGFIFGFSFLDICFTFPYGHNKPLVESLSLTRDQTLGIWSGSTDPKTLDDLRTNPREYQMVRTHTKETTWIQDLASPSHQQHLMWDASSKQQTKQKYKSNHQQTGVLSHLAFPIREKTNKNSAQISPYTKLTQTTGSTLRGLRPKGRKNSTFFKERIQLSLKPGKRRPQTSLKK